MKRSCLILLLLVIGACGGSEPQPPKPAAPKPQPTEKPDTGQADSLDREASQRALSGIEGATTEDEANQARATYGGTADAAMLDRVLGRKLIALDFAHLTEVVNAIKETKTPDAADDAAKSYTGTRYGRDLSVALEEHIDALIKKDPTLARSGGGTTKPPVTSATDLNSLFKNCRTESDAAAARAAYQGPGTESEIEAARELWRWQKPERVSECSVPLALSNIDRYLRLTDGRIVITGPQGAAQVIDKDGNTRQTLRPEGQDRAVVVGTSPDEKFLFTACGNENGVQKWNLETGELVISFARAEKPRTLQSAYTALVPDCSGIITCDSLHEVSLWSTETGELVRSLGTVRQIRGIQFSADSKVVCIGGQDVLRGVELSTGREVCSWKFENAAFASMAVSPDGIKAAFRTWEPGAKTAEGLNGPGTDYLKVIDLSTGEGPPRLKIDSSVENVFWLASGKHLLVTHKSSFSLLDAETLKLVYEHPLEITNASSAMSAESKTITFLSRFHKSSNPQNLKTFGRQP